jgi:hypothetical protein
MAASMENLIGLFGSSWTIRPSAARAMVAKLRSATSAMRTTKPTLETVFTCVLL